MTQVELAEASGVSQSNISNYERARTLPDIPTLHALADAAGFQLRMTLDEKDQQRSSVSRQSFDEGIAANEDAVRNVDLLTGVFGG